MGAESKAERDARFTTFVTQATPSLVRTATFLTGSTHAAQELVQGALVKAYGAWARVEAGSEEAYVRRILVNRRTDAWRRTRGELSVATPPDRTSVDPSAVEDRDQLYRMLGRLPEQQRKVVVLRFYCDLSERDTATTLGVSVGAVKSATHRALTSLRTHHATLQGELR